MPELIEAYWPYFLIAIVIGIAIAWLAIVATRRTSVTTDRRDVLDEGAAPAARNQTLIDTPAAATPPETTAAAPEPATAPAKAPSPTPEPHPAGSTQSDDLTRIKGLGPKLATLLGTHGITRFDQVATWDDAEIDRIDSQLGRFQGRIRRDNWVEQAKMLASGNVSDFSDKFGNNH